MNTKAAGIPVGIDDISLFIPSPLVKLDSILKHRSQDDPGIARRLRRAIEATGQLALRFPNIWEDSVTMAAEAIRQLLSKHNPVLLRYLAVGTETAVDMAKPIAAYVQGLLQRSHVAIPREVSTFQVQHACAGGTIALLGVCAMLYTGGNIKEQGVIACSDIARYETPSTAEITQGAGAAAILASCNPRLLELDLSTVGYASADVDDFFRPLHSTTARVKGRYSVECYNDALHAAFTDHCKRRQQSPQEILKQTDIFIPHVPFYKMAVTALTRLIETTMNITPSETHTFLEHRHYHNSLAPIKHIGNIYSGAVYMALMFSLAEWFRIAGDAIIGKRVLLFSYGSGNTMTVIAGCVAPQAAAVIEHWNIQKILHQAKHVDFSAYEQFLSVQEPYTIDTNTIPDGSYYLANIREDGYRQYEYANTT